MGDIFSPEERLANIMWVLDQLQDRRAESDADMKEVWAMAINVHLGRLVQAVDDMRPKDADQESK